MNDQPAVPALPQPGRQFGDLGAAKIFGCCFASPGGRHPRHVKRPQASPQQATRPGRFRHPPPPLQSPAGQGLLCLHQLVRRGSLGTRCQQLLASPANECDYHRRRVFKRSGPMRSQEIVGRRSMSQPPHERDRARGDKKRSRYKEQLVFVLHLPPRAMPREQYCTIARVPSSRGCSSRICGDNASISVSQSLSARPTCRAEASTKTAPPTGPHHHRPGHPCRRHEPGWANHSGCTAAVSEEEVKHYEQQPRPMPPYAPCACTRARRYPKCAWPSISPRLRYSAMACRCGLCSPSLATLPGHSSGPYADRLV